MPDYSEVEHLLDTYTFDELLELSDLTEEDVIYILINAGYVDAPDPSPLDFG